LTPAQLLRSARTIAVVGLSSDPDRSSFGVAQYLQRAGYRIIPVNPKETSVLGEKAWPSLLDVPDEIDIVDIFRRPVDVPPVVQQAIQVGAKAVWMQLGIRNEEAAEQARQAGLMVVQDNCIAVTHRLMPVSAD
jgi:predicted CoA-binding protein